MAEEEKKQIRESEGVEPGTRESTGLETAPKAEEKPADNHIAEKRGRMITSGIVAAVLVSVIAVAVAAIFQLTSTWLIKCPQDLSVNDPAPVLWSDLISEKDKRAPLGVPEKLAKESSFKGLPAATK